MASSSIPSATSTGQSEPSPGETPPPNLPIIPVTPEVQELTYIFIGLSSTLIFVALLTMARRIYVKVNLNRNFGLDDYCIIASLACILAYFGMGMALAAPYLQPMISLATASNSAKLATFGTIVWSTSMSLIKISICFSLLRFFITRTWRIFLYVLIVFTAFTWTVSTLFVILQCRPMSTLWDVIAQQNPDGTSGGKCLHASVLRAFSSTYSVINIATDFIVSLLPLEFIFRLQRPTREKTLLFVLMALGLLASATSAVRLHEYQAFGKPNMDFFPTSAKVTLLNMVEQTVAFIAANLPSFKLLFQNFLQRIGLSVTSYSESHGRAGLNGKISSFNIFSTGPARRDGPTRLERLGQSQHSASQEKIYPMKTFDRHIPADCIVRTDAVSMTSSSHQEDWSNQDASPRDDHFGGRVKKDGLV